MKYDYYLYLENDTLFIKQLSYFNRYLDENDDVQTGRLAIKNDVLIFE